MVKAGAEPAHPLLTQRVGRRIGPIRALSALNMHEAIANHRSSVRASGQAVPSLPPRLGHIEQLDGLRGLAIVLVMFFHMTMVQPVGAAAIAWDSFCRRGGFGVDVFFVLSGFLITGILIDALHQPHYFRNFYARRALRIFPLYYAVLVFSFLLLPRIAPSTAVRYASVNREAVWYWLHLSNFAIARRGGFLHGILDVSWSLAIEEQFYLLWPAVVWWLSRARLRWLCLGLIAVSVASRTLLTAWHAAPVAVYTLTFCRLDGLAIGALTAIVVRGRSPASIRALLSRSLQFTCPLCLLFLLPLAAPVADAINVVGGYLLASALTGCAILAVVGAPTALLIRPLEWKALRLFGRYSYALYLFHYPISAAIRDFVLKPARMPVLLGSSLPSLAFFYLVTGSASLCAAFLSWHLYEKRFLRLKRFFA